MQSLLSAPGGYSLVVERLPRMQEAEVRFLLDAPLASVVIWLGLPRQPKSSTPGVHHQGAPRAFSFNAGSVNIDLLA